MVLFHAEERVDLRFRKCNVERCAKRERGQVHERPVPVPLYINFGDGWKGGMVVSDFTEGAEYPPRL